MLRIGGPFFRGRVLRCRICGHETVAVGERRERLLEIGESPMNQLSGFPKGVEPPLNQDDTVQVLMPYHLIRCFERRCLPVSAALAGPVVFSDDDLPTYLIEVR